MPGVPGKEEHRLPKKNKARAHRKIVHIRRTSGFGDASEPAGKLIQLAKQRLNLFVPTDAQALGERAAVGLGMAGYEERFCVKNKPHRVSEIGLLFYVANPELMRERDQGRWAKAEYRIWAVRHEVATATSAQQQFI